jgi:hypothetical protein
VAQETVLHLLDRVSPLRSQCDLDVLVYLYRHSDALLSGERIAAAVGCGLKQVAGSLDSFVFAGLLTRTRSRTEGVYVFTVSRPPEPPLASLLEMASSRPGRLRILQALRRAPSATLE